MFKVSVFCFCTRLTSGGAKENENPCEKQRRESPSKRAGDGQAQVRVGGGLQTPEQQRVWLRRKAIAKMSVPRERNSEEREVIPIEREGMGSESSSKEARGARTSVQLRCGKVKRNKKGRINTCVWEGAKEKSRVAGWRRRTIKRGRESSGCE